MLNFNCEKCDADLEIEDLHDGEMVLCPICNSYTEATMSSVSVYDDRNSENQILLSVKLITGIIAIIIFFFTILFGGFKFCNYVSANREEVTKTIEITFTIAGAIGLILAIFGIVTSCPKCKKWFARVQDNKLISNKEKKHGLVTRKAYTRTSGIITNSHGQIGNTYSSSETSWQERVPIVKITYKLHYHCKFCTHKWIGTKEVEFEDFD